MSSLSVVALSVWPRLTGCWKHRPQTRLLLLEKEPRIGRASNRQQQRRIAFRPLLQTRFGKGKIKRQRPATNAPVSAVNTASRTSNAAKSWSPPMKVNWLRLENLWQRGQANGLQGLRKLTPEQIKEIEPHATGLAAIHVPQEGIVDYPAVCGKLGELIRQNGRRNPARTRACQN